MGSDYRSCGYCALCGRNVSPACRDFGEAQDCGLYKRLRGPMGKSNTMTTTEPANNEAPDRFPEMSPRGTKTGEQRQPEAGKVADPVHLPQHYSRWKVEPIYFIRENNLPFWMGNVIKYVMRAEFKNGIEDLKKARRYIDMEILKQQGNEDWAK